MPRSVLGFLMRSPLVRHPTLLVRKIRERAGFPIPVAPAPVTPLDYRPQATIADLLRRWLGAVQSERRGIPAELVFGVRFDRSDLLRWCANGPEPGTGLAADIKTPWEFARSQHMPLLAAFPAPDQVDPLARRLAAEIHELANNASNLNGPLWSNPMEVAIRAINWTAADDLLNGRLSDAFGVPSWATLLHRHGQIIAARLEARLRSSNHYLADLLGLSWIARHFPDDRDAQKWRRFADREFPVALRAQCFPDGGAYEASLSYHALIVEMALLHIALLNKPPDRYLHHTRRMIEIVAAARRADGSLFSLGDNDSGRIFAIDRLTPGRGYADALVALAQIALGEAVLSKSRLFLKHTGWYFYRDDDWHLAMTFGGVGFAGQGAHAHCDRFSFCLDRKGCPVFIDPGSYIYTGDPAARNRFRRASAHNVFAPDRKDPYPITDTPNALFALPGPARAARARLLNNGIYVSGAQYGFPQSRSLERTDTGWRLQDSFRARDPIAPVWFFQLAPDLHVDSCGSSIVRIAGAFGEIRLEPEFACKLEVSNGEYSPHYGYIVSCPRIVAEAAPTRSGCMTWRISAV